MLAALLLVPLAQSQSPDAPHPSPDAMVMYAHGTGSDEGNGFMNTLEEDGGDNALGPSSSCAAYEGVDLLADDVSRTYTFALDPALVHAVLLDTAGTIDVVTHLGAGGCDGDEVEITARLEQGDTVVAESDAVAHTWTGGAPYDTAEFSMSPQLDRIEPGQPLVWTLDIEGTYYGQMFLGISDEQGHTRMTLPITGVDAPPEAPTNTTHHGVLDEAGIDLSFSNATSDTYLYNWTVEGGAWTIGHNITVAAGDATMALSDSNGTALFETAIAEDTAGTSPALDMQPGEYQVRLVFDGFVGDVSIQVALAGTGSLDDDATDDETTDDDSTGNETLDGGGDDKGSPGIGAVGLVGAIGAIALLRRRP